MATKPVRESTFERCLREFKDKLSVEQRKEFSDTTLTDLQTSVAAIEKKQRETRTNQNLKRIAGFLEAMESNAKTIEVFLNVHNFVGVIWGPMKFLLQAASNHAKAFNAILDAYQRIGENLPIFAQYQELFEADDQHMRQILEMNFQDILEFHEKAIKFFRRSVWKQTFDAFWVQFESKFAHILQNMSSHKKLLENKASLMEFEQAKRARLLAEKEFKSLQEQEDLRKRDFLVTLLAAADVHCDQERCREERKPYPESGKWLFAKPQFRAWFDPQSYSAPLLWIYGKPGIGKSVLASMVIDEAENLHIAKVLYFYCRYGDPKRQKFSDMTRSLLSQALLMDPSIVPYLYETVAPQGNSCLDVRKSAEKILDVCLKAIGPSYIIIDGLDECPTWEQKAMVSWLCEFIDDSSSEPESSRCLFFSQYDESTRSLLSKRSKLGITAGDNKADLHLYCQSWASRIKVEFDLTDDECSNIAITTSARAEGMFLFAKLVLSNLIEQTSAAAVMQQMAPGTFPDGLEQAYQRILDRILDPSRPARSDAHRLLAWITCATRTLRWREIQGAVAIDTEKEDVDMARSRWRKDHTGLCGSLVEEQPNGALDVVHSTAKHYLVKSGILAPKLEHLKLTLTCLEYLNLPALECDILIEKLRSNIGRGVYAFLDYAIIGWSDHMIAALQHDSQPQRSPEIDDTIQTLAETLDPFLELHWRPFERRSKIPKRVVDSVYALQRPHLHEKLLLTMASMCNFTTQEVPNMKSLMTLDLFDVLGNIRKETEAMADDPTYTSVMKDFYGDRPFKCSRLYCDYFHEGFRTEKQRQVHIQKHDRSYYCPHSGCSYARIGCTTKKELETHIATYHNSKPKETDFAPVQEKIQKTSAGGYQCPQCVKKFTKASNMRAHLRTHSGEKPFACTKCDKGFRRDHDRKMHEKICMANEKMTITCIGTTKSGAPWGCGKSFPNANALARHFGSKIARKCTRPLREEQKSESQDKQHTDLPKEPALAAPLASLAKIISEDSEISAILPALLKQHPELADVDLEAVQFDSPSTEDNNAGAGMYSSTIDLTEPNTPEASMYSTEIDLTENNNAEAGIYSRTIDLTEDNISDSK